MITTTWPSLLVLIGLSVAVEAFTVVSRPPIHRSTLFSTLEYDRAREAFESLIHPSSLAQPPVLTSAARHRRLLEIDLLQSLADSDEGVDELMHLWMYEQSAEEALLLTAMETTCSEGLVDEEAQLRAMIRDHEQWAEPRVRLATLLFFKGRTAEAYQTALEARRVKPWHFELCPLLIMLSLRDQDLGRALYWARQGLPALRPGGPGKRRRAWVAEAVARAREQLAAAQLESEERRRDKVSGEVWQ